MHLPFWSLGRYCKFLVQVSALHLWGLNDAVVSTFFVFGVFFLREVLTLILLWVGYVAALGDVDAHLIVKCASELRIANFEHLAQFDVLGEGFLRFGQVTEYLIFLWAPGPPLGARPLGKHLSILLEM